MPHIKEFVEHQDSDKKLKNVEVDFKRGAPPVLLLYDADGNEAEPVAVGQWKTEHIIEYLQNKVTQA